MNSSILGQLQELNFSQNEAKVYAALLEIGQTSAGEIIKKTGFHRSVVYETLDKLIARKLVFQLEKQKIAFYQPTNPERILQTIKSQEEIALELIPKLKSLIDTKLPEITIYQGVDEWRRFWLEKTAQAPVGSIDYVAGSMGKKWNEYARPILEKYIKLRVERKIKWQMIIFDKDELEMDLLKKYPTLHEYRLIERNTLPEGNFNVLEDMLILNSGTEPMIIEVKNPTLVRVFKNIFDILWENGKPL